ncbi:winged helix-turn-helix domain-containing protein [Hydrogenophaga sp. R2]|uniref:winged helix-turn-helix domain-containing protein n=1 Tax=Hydrogenophaga sp. R2 TaxID=3132827 RepID=UPI003CE8A8E9
MNDDSDVNLSPAFSSQSRAVFHFGEFTVRCDTREATRHGELIRLERRAFDLLAYLLHQEGRVVTKGELLEKVWFNHFVCDSVIAQCIMKVRKALGDNGQAARVIKTVHRVGYRVGLPVKREGAHPELGADATADNAEGGPQVIWLPTEPPADQESLSWVKTGLLPVAAHVLRSRGIAVFQLDAATPDATENPLASGTVRLDAGSTRGEAAGIVTSRLRLDNDVYRFDWQLQLASEEFIGTAEGGSPVELALQAAGEIAPLLRC